MAKTLILDPIWDPKKIFNGFLPLLVVRQCSKLSPYTISRKNNEPNLKKWQKTQFWAWFWTIYPKFVQPIFLFAGLPLLALRHCSPSYHPMQLKGKLRHQSLEKNKKPDFGPNFCLLDANLGPNFFGEFYL